MLKRLLFFLIILISISVIPQLKKTKYSIRTIAFYNLENLFDTINDKTINDQESPIMKLKSGKSEVYFNKLKNLSEVISKIGKAKTNNTPVLIGVAEAENKKVLEDLIENESLKNKNYGIIHFNSPDRRGIDVALLYQKRYFKPIHFEVFNPNIYSNHFKVYTRDILWVHGYLDDEKIHVIVNHWPSRRGGEAKSRKLREKAAFRVTQIIQKIKSLEDNPKIIIMGDFNDDPINTSFKKVLKAKKEIKNLDENDIYNPFEQMFLKGHSSLGYRDHINLFDQVLVSNAFINQAAAQFSSYKLFNAHIYNPRFLTQKSGRYKGYPFRSFLNGKFSNGYSDHYPVYIYLIKKKSRNNRD